MPTSKEATISIVISLLVIVLVFSSVADVLAKPRKPSITCRPVPTMAGNFSKQQCCQSTKISPGITLTYCTTCDNTNPPSNCSDRYCVSGCAYANALTPLGNNTKQRLPTNELPSSSPPALSNALPPSSQQRQQTTTMATCPDGSTPNANGNCPNTSHSTTTNQQASSSPPPTTTQHHHKGSNNLEGGQQPTSPTNNKGKAQKTG
jgi:hypothetical protein